MSHESVRGSGCTDPHYLTSVLFGGEWSALNSSRLTTREIFPDTHWIGAWVGLRIDLDDTEK
jgi:hypothetical protein